MLFAIIGTIVLVCILLFRIFVKIPITGALALFKGKTGGCGCFLGGLAVLFVGGLLIWYIISDLF